MIEIPTLETERLILRAPKFEDLEPMEVFFADPVRMKFLGGPIKRGDVWRDLLRTAGHWQIRGYGFWHIEDRETGIMCGYTGFLKHIEHPEEELVWRVFEGLGSENGTKGGARVARAPFGGCLEANVF